MVKKIIAFILFVFCTRDINAAGSKRKRFQTDSERALISMSLAARKKERRLLHAVYARELGHIEHIGSHDVSALMRGEKELQLRNAVYEGDLGHIRRLVKQGARVEFIYNGFDHIARTPLHLAAIKGHPDVVRYLVEDCRVSPELIAVRGGDTALHQATRAGHVGIARYLVEEAGMNPNFQAFACFDGSRPLFGPTPLDVAVQLGRIGIVKYLVGERGVDADQVTGVADTSLLCVASQAGDIGIVRCLVEDGHADINKTDILGWAPIHAAVARGRENIFDFLLSLKDPVTGQLKCDWKKITTGLYGHSLLSLAKDDPATEPDYMVAAKRRMRARIKGMVIDDLPEGADCKICLRSFGQYGQAPQVLTCCMNVLCAHDIDLSQRREDRCLFCSHFPIETV